MGEGPSHSPLRSPIDAEIVRYDGIQRKTEKVGFPLVYVWNRDSLRRPEMGERRMGWDSNPRGACTPAGFQDRCLQPLGHPSVSCPVGRRVNHSIRTPRPLKLGVVLLV